VIAIHAHAVPGVQRCGCASHENGARHEVLKVAFGGEQSFPVGKVLHGEDCDMESFAWHRPSRPVEL
jgi:hypothetical protein